MLPTLGSPKTGMRNKYGINFPEKTSDIEIELFMFREKVAKTLVKPDLQFTGGRGPEFHFKNIAKAIWPEVSTPQLPVSFIWHVWADKMLHELCRNKYLGIAGPTGCGKSEIMALWVIINYLSDPVNTLGMVTSTTIKEAGQRIWGKVVKYWFQAQSLGFPGKLVESLHLIRYIDPDGKAPMGDMAGIQLIPGEKSKERDALGKLIGIHPINLFFVADEMDELSKAIPEAVYYNLSHGCKKFQFTGVTNPKTRFSAFGEFAEPKEGWNSITVDSEEWITKRGKVIHFDTLKNPRITHGDERLFWMHSRDAITAEIALHGENTATFWRMFRGFWCPMGTVDFIYSEIEILNAKANEKAIWLDDRLTPISFLDPSFTNGGDRAVATFGTLGKNLKGHPCINVEEQAEFKEDVTNKEVTRSEQLIRWWKAECENRGITPKNAAYDATGSGIAFGHLVQILWSPEVLGINFGGKASDNPVSAYDATPCHEKYCNRVSEIWYSAKDAFRNEQIKGLTPELIEEICQRKKEEEKGLHLRMRVMPKSEMKATTGKSPDMADSFFGLIMLCKERLNFDSHTVTLGKSTTRPQWKQLFQKYKDVYAHQPTSSH